MFWCDTIVGLCPIDKEMFGVFFVHSSIVMQFGLLAEFSLTEQIRKTTVLHLKINSEGNSLSYELIHSFKKSQLCCIADENTRGPQGGGGCILAGIGESGRKDSLSLA